MTIFKIDHTQLQGISIALYKVYSINYSVKNLQMLGKVLWPIGKANANDGDREIYKSK